MSEEKKEMNEATPERVKPVPLNDWVPEEDDIIFELCPGANKVRASLDKTGIIGDNDLFKEKIMLLSTFSIKQKHYMERMVDITKVINYFIKFYDHNDEYLTALISLKYHIDSERCRNVRAYQGLLIHNMVTPSMTEKLKTMIDDLYTINIETEKSSTYKATPKLTNADAKNILLLSYYFRLILPITIHWFNLPTTEGVENGKNYIQTFVCIFLEVTRAISVDTMNVYILIKQLIKHRVEKKFNSDAIIHEKKKEKNGATDASYCNELADEILLVKSLYKIDYSQSVVSYIDGIIRNNYMQYNIENFKFKTVGISAEEFSKDSDEGFSNYEQIENRAFHINAYTSIIERANIENCMRDIKFHFNKIEITTKEFDFYYNFIPYLNGLSKFFITAYFQKYFRECDFIDLINKTEATTLLIILKHYLIMRGFVIIPQILTARMVVEKDNAIKNRKFNEKFDNCAINNEIISNRYSYISQVVDKGDLLKKYVSTIINSTFTYIDYDDPFIHGEVVKDLNQDLVIHEFESFLQISFTNC